MIQLWITKESYTQKKLISATKNFRTSSTL